MADRSTEIPDDDRIRRAQDAFIATWGKMGSAWGISRTMAEVHALLFITGDPLCTDDVMERLEISRGNASMSLRALQDWGIVYRVHKRGDRKEYFEAESNVSTMFKTIARERKKRELDPIIASLYEIRDMTGVSGKAGANGAGTPVGQHNYRLDEMLEVIHQFDALSRAVIEPDGKGLKLALNLLGKAAGSRGD